MIKKLLAIVLSVLMLASVFVGCSAKKTDLGDGTTDTKAVTKAQTTPEDEDEDVDTPDEDLDDNDGDAEDSEATNGSDEIDMSANPDFTVDDTSIYEKLTIKDLLKPENFEGSDIPDSVDYGGYEFRLLADSYLSHMEFVAQSDGDIIKDAVISRQNFVEEYYSIG